MSRPPLFGVARKPVSPTTTPGQVSDNDRPNLPTLPKEVQFLIIEYAMTSKYPIVDPLSKSTQDNMSDEEKQRGNQIAIGCMAVCSAFRNEATRILWTKNTFTFTTPMALRNFCNLPLEHRQDIKHVNLRVIATYYDDEPRCHQIPQSYHPALRKDLSLKVRPRILEKNLTPKGFRAYTWAQAVDFLAALCPPFDPNHLGIPPRLRLLPGLETMRIDFVNFIERFLSFPDGSLRLMAANELGCTLNELMVTGLPCSEQGIRIGSELTGMLKDGGLFLDAAPTYVQTLGSTGQTCMWCLHSRPYIPKAIRALRKFKEDGDGNDDNYDSDPSRHEDLPRMPACPEVAGHPMSTYVERPTVWKKVPFARDEEERGWLEFDRGSGYPVGNAPDTPPEDDRPHDVVFGCAKCDEMHGRFGRGRY